MKKYNEFVLSLIEATREKKIKWNQSSAKGGYFSKVGDNGIEVLPPIDTNRAVLRIVNEINAQSFRQEEIRGEREWRVVVYDSEGGKQFIITSSKVDTEFFSKALGIEVNNPIKLLSMAAEYVLEEEESEKLNLLINKINSLS